MPGTLPAGTVVWSEKKSTAASADPFDFFWKSLIFTFTLSLVMLLTTNQAMPSPVFACIFDGELESVPSDSIVSVRQVMLAMGVSFGLLGDELGELRLAP